MGEDGRGWGERRGEGRERGMSGGRGEKDVKSKRIP